MDPATTRLTLNSRGPLSLSALSFWQGTTVNLPFAIFEEGSTTDLVSDFSNLVSVKLEIRLGRHGGGPIIIQPTEIDPVDLNAALTIEQWTAGTHQHGTFTLSALEMDQYVPASVLECWISIYSETVTGGRISHGAGTFQIYRNRAGGVGSPTGSESAPIWTIVSAPDGAKYAKADYGAGNIGYVPLITSLP